jgi:hypothetical protein
MIPELIEACESLIEVIEKGNAKGTYYYEDLTLKHWWLGAGGRAGNCENCIENEDAGWIEESEPFPADGQYGVVDEPPLHDHCDCSVEYKDSRRRVYF